jgi:phytoene synthase
MSVAECAALVQRGDPDRFRATMAAPVAARAVLFPIYAFNLEVARAPWVTKEPMIAQMRLQWWRDALSEIATGGMVRRHEVVVPLAQVLNPDQATRLQAVIDAREADLERTPFADDAALWRYLEATAGRLTEVAASALGSCDAGTVSGFGTAAGLANYLRAVPALEAAGRQPLPDGRPAALRALAAEGLRRLSLSRAGRAGVSRASGAALLAGWRAGGILRRAVADPARVAAGGLDGAPVTERTALMARALTGRW